MSSSRLASLQVLPRGAFVCAQIREMNWRLNKIPQFVPRVGKLPTGLCCDVHHECKVNTEWKSFSRVVRREREREKERKRETHRTFCFFFVRKFRNNMSKMCQKCRKTSPLEQKNFAYPLGPQGILLDRGRLNPWI